MKIISYRTAFVCLAAILVSLNGSAQGLKFELSFSGTCISNNANGRLTGTSISSRDWLLDYARSHGVSDLRRIKLVYHLGESSLGDTIEVVDAASGAVLDRPFLLYFGEDAELGRTGLTNSIGTQIVRLEYVYTPQNGHSMGSFFLSERAALAADGSITNAAIQGRMQYVYLADATHNLQMCSDVLATGKLVRFPNQ